MKRFIITESERNSIINLYYSKEITLLEQESAGSTVLDLQKMLNSKYSAGLTEDGKLGPKTLAAIESAMSKTSNETATPKPEVSGSTANQSTTTPSSTTPAVAGTSPETTQAPAPSSF